MLIRRERVEDRAAVYELNVAAFGTPAEADLVERLRRDADPCISLVAESAGRVVGHICFSPVTATNHPQPGVKTRMMGLAPMAVADSHRNQGVGSALVREGLKRCAQAGFGAVVVLGHPGYYPRFGFSPAALYNLESEYDSPPEAFMAIELQHSFLSDVRGVVSYHPAFKSLDETPESTDKQDSAGDSPSRGNDDTTATSRLEDELRRSEAVRQAVWESALDAIITMDSEGTILDFNPAAEHIFGYARSAAIGQKLDELIVPAALREGHRRGLQRYLATGESRILNRRMELPALRADGSEFPVELTVVAVTGGVKPYFIGSIRDIRERKHLEEHVRQIQKLDSIGRLAAGIAHDFNNLLTVQQGYLSLLLMESGLPAHIVESLQEVAAASERAADLTRQLLLFSRKQVMQRRNLNLNEVIVNISRMLGRAIEEHITMRTDCDAQLPPVNADPGMIEQVLMNLVLNARDAMPEGGRITISTEAASLEAAAVRERAEARSGRFVILTVADTGSGIAPEVIENIFEPFFTTKDVGKGTGLGLATVHGIVKQHDGWIEVESAPGKGAVFRIYLPTAGGAADALEPVSPLPSLRGGSETILAVEDEDALREILKMVLERYGYRVLIASSGVEALELWREHAEAVDLLLTDMVLPHGISGRELAERLRAERADLKVLVMSGYDPRAIAANEGDAATANRYRFLQKPYVPSELIRAVRECLDGRT
ncbi:MAG: GNAT family N-acetyltransferase [Acidobacteria bacterium]|nr:GNAT family N-acetyltransferase [Acidobacteriota bacterium]